jgi:hypothetical protein
LTETSSTADERDEPTGSVSVTHSRLIVVRCQRQTRCATDHFAVTFSRTRHRKLAVSCASTAVASSTCHRISPVVVTGDVADVVVTRPASRGNGGAGFRFAGPVAA